MTSLLERCIATRRGRTIVTRGEAGIGKTRLLEELAEAARAQGADCHRVQVLDFGQVKARRPLAALVSSLLGLGTGGESRRARPRDRGGDRVGSPARRRRSCTRAASSARRSPRTRSRSSAISMPRRSSMDGMEVVRRLIESACARRRSCSSSRTCTTRAARKRRGSGNSRRRSPRSRPCSCSRRGRTRIQSTPPGARARAAAR